MLAMPGSRSLLPPEKPVPACGMIEPTRMRRSAARNSALISTGVPRLVVPIGTQPSQEKWLLVRQAARTSAPTLRSRSARVIGRWFATPASRSTSFASMPAWCSSSSTAGTRRRPGVGRVRSSITMQGRRRPRASSRRRGAPIGCSKAARTPASPTSGPSRGGQSATRHAAGNSSARSRSSLHAPKRMRAIDAGRSPFCVGPTRASLPELPRAGACYTLPDAAMPLLARAISLWLFPLVLGGALLAAVRVIDAGVRPADAVALPMLGSALAVLLAERLAPHLPAWQRSHRDVLVDLAHVLSVTATSILVQRIVPALLAPVAARLAAQADGAPWPAGWPWPAQLALALVVAELFQYWSHRLSHEWEPFWRLHATHHSAPRLYFLNAARFHPLDIAIDTSVGLVPLVLLGAGAPAQALFALFTAVFGYLQHCNVSVSLGRFNYLFSMAELHRWHHAKDAREANTNYGSNLSVWDLAFGTFFWPRDREPPEEIGIPELPAFPQGFWGQLASPFRWRAIQAASRAGGASR